MKARLSKLPWGCPRQLKSTISLTKTRFQADRILLKHERSRDSPMPLNYINGDATKPIGTGNRIITHCCNDLGFWNAGFVKALSRRWSEPERAYRSWAAGNERLPFALGKCSIRQG